MLYHRALGRDLATLAVAVVDNRRSMLLVMRAMLAAIGTGSVDTYENPGEAVDALARTTPDLVIAADMMQPLTGPALVRTMRRARSGPLALVPAIIMSAHGRPGLVADALRAGARFSFFRLRRARSPGGSTGCSTTIVHSSSGASIMSLQASRNVCPSIFIGWPILRPKQATRS
jgi:CheY-like chemotaxis protein